MRQGLPTEEAVRTVLSDMTDVAATVAILCCEESEAAQVAMALEATNYNSIRGNKMFVPVTWGDLRLIAEKTLRVCLKHLEAAE